MKRVRSASIQERHFIDIPTKLNTSGSRDQWNPFDWFLFSRYYQRTGNIRSTRTPQGRRRVDSCQFELGRSYDNVFCFSSQNYWQASANTRRPKRRSCNRSGRHVRTCCNCQGTDQHSKVCIAKLRALPHCKRTSKAGLADEATSTAQLISSPSYLSAAHWIVAMHLRSMERRKPR